MKTLLVVVLLFVFGCTKNNDFKRVHVGMMNVIVLDSNKGQSMDYFDECWSYHDSICMNINHYKITNK